MTRSLRFGRVLAPPATRQATCGRIKTPDEVALYGGTAGEQYDPCYHLACDTFDNISLFALEVNSDAAAYATLNYAMSTELINGGVSKGNFKPGTNANSNPADWLSDAA